jgi:hypothetical protein
MSEEQDARWQQIVDARVDFSEDAPLADPAADPAPYDDDDVIPLQAAEQSRASRSSARKAAQFNEALSSFSDWSSVEPRRRRMSA